MNCNITVKGDFEGVIKSDPTPVADKINEAAKKHQKVEDILKDATAQLKAYQWATHNPYLTYQDIAQFTYNDTDLAESIRKRQKREKEEKLKKQNEEEWIWVRGFKGTDKNMKCHGYQFEVGKKFDMPADELIVECKSGFHFCKELKDVFNYYCIGNGRRFFEVSALVRKADVDEYGKATSNYRYLWSSDRKDKLVAKSILFTRELTADEILSTTDTTGWTDDDKKLALAKGIETVANKKKVVELTTLGYSEAFAEYMVEEGCGYYNRAKKVASQKDLSMDMKVLAILRM